MKDNGTERKDHMDTLEATDQPRASALELPRSPQSEPRRSREQNTSQEREGVDDRQPNDNPGIVAGSETHITTDAVDSRRWKSKQTNDTVTFQSEIRESEDSQKRRKRHSDSPRTDAGNAELFAVLYEKNLRYDHKRKRWLRWRKHWWVEDRLDRVIQFAKNLARKRLANAEEISDDALRQQEVQWAINSENLHRLKATVELAKSEPVIADSGDNWDRDPWLFGVANGVIDLHTGKLRDGKTEDRITLHSDVPFDPNAQCPLWLTKLNEIFQGNQEVVDYFQRVVGYTLTGSTREQCYFNLYGGGANGKSLVLETLRHILGPYAGAAPFSMFEYRNKASIPSDVAATEGKRLLTASETDDSIRLNEPRIKSMTGGDKQTARALYKDWKEFESTAKILLAFNHKPEILDDSDGMRRRVRLIPFDRQFRPDEQDKTLKEKLQKEAAGILAWAVRGCLEWQKRGLDEPRAIVEATEQYRQESDSFGRFISECCVVREDRAIQSSRLSEKYREWAAENEVTVIGTKAMARRLKSLGLTATKFDNGRSRGWKGIGLKDDEPGELSKLSA